MMSPFHHKAVHKRLSTSESINSVSSLLPSSVSTSSSFANSVTGSVTSSVFRHTGSRFRHSLTRRLSTIKTSVKREWKRGAGKEVVCAAFSQQTTNVRHSGLFIMS